MRPLAKGEFVEAAWAAPASGPGWANSPVIVLINQTISGEYRLEWIQPDDQTDGMHWLYRVSEEVSARMRAEAERVLTPKGKARRAGT